MPHGIKNDMKRHIDYGHVAFALAVIIVLIFGVDFARRTWNRLRSGDLTFSTPEASTTENPTDPTDPDSSSEPEGSSEQAGDSTYKLIELSFSDTQSGPLVLVDDTHAYHANVELSSFLGVKNESFKLKDFSLLIHPDVLEPLNQLFADFQANSGLGNVMLYSTNETYAGGVYPENHPERATGYCADLMLVGEDALSRFDGTGSYTWIPDYCHQYGFVIRFPEGKEDQTGFSYEPWHLRYVGEVHATAMKAGNFCLEEYLEAMQQYSANGEQLTVTLADGSVWSCYYAAASQSGTTQVPVPEKSEYLISGDNQGGFIIAWKTSAPET